MTFRCPYCKKDIGPVAAAKCPHCGHVMAVRTSSDLAARKLRRKKIEAIRQEAERRKRALGGGAPSLPRGPSFYLVAISAFVILLVVALKFSSSPEMKDGRLTGTASNINLLAEALGRFKFHTGAFPSTADGLAALTWIETERVPGYNGPYLMNRLVPKDGWKAPYRYEAPARDAAGAAPEPPAPGPDGQAGTEDDVYPADALPTLASAGPDGVFGTADDIRPDPACFYRAGRDTSWTNEWVPYAKRGVRILSKEQKAAVLEAEARRRMRAAEPAAPADEEAK